MTTDRFDEYGHYGAGEAEQARYENNPPLAPSVQKNDRFFVEFIKERELPNGEVVMTFDLGPEAVKAASELGLKLLMYMGVLNISSEKAFEILWDSRKEETDPMTDDLVKRLREGDHFEKVMSAGQAADRIEELSNCVTVLEAKLAECEARLGKAVEQLLGAAAQLDDYVGHGYGDEYREAVAELLKGDTYNGN